VRHKEVLVDQAATPLLETRALTKEFRGFRAVSEVDLVVREGTMHALVGPNGAGKTTLFNLLTGFLTPTSGTIVFADQDITGRQPEQIAHLGIARSFQITSLFDQLTLGEHLELALASPTGMGMQFWRSVNRLAIFRNRSMELLDEPTAGMGIEDVERTIALVKQISTGRTVVFVDHNMHVVGSLADTVTVLQSGSVLAEGPYEQVRQDERVITAYLGSAHA